MRTRCRTRLASSTSTTAHGSRAWSTSRRRSCALGCGCRWRGATPPSTASECGRSSVSDDDLVLVERSDGLLLLTLNRPEQRNPVDHATVRRLHDLLANADADSDITAVVLTGADPAFSAGGDLRGYLSLYKDEAQFRSFLHDFTAVNALL